MLPAATAVVQMVCAPMRDREMPRLAGLIPYRSDGRKGSPQTGCPLVHDGNASHVHRYGHRLGYSLILIASKSTKTLVANRNAIAPAATVATATRRAFTAIAAVVPTPRRR